MRRQVKKYFEKELIVNKGYIELKRMMKFNESEVNRKNLYHRKYIEDILINNQLKLLINTNQKKKNIIKESLDNIELINNTPN